MSWLTWLKRLFRRLFSRKEERKRVLLLVDFENLIITALKDIPATEFSIDSGFRRIIEKITEEVGEIVGVFAFLPSNSAIIWGKDLHLLGFNIISCPRVRDKKGIEQDTTDTRLLELGEWLINNIAGLTHLCVGSGDKDFSPLMRKAALKGLKRIVIAADLKSLSSDLIKLTDRKSEGGGKMVYLFLPQEE